MAVSPDSIITSVPSKIAFAVSSKINSRIILDDVGAETLLSKGDALFRPMGELVPQRVQGAFVSDAEIERVAGWLKRENGAAQYDETLMAWLEKDAEILGLTIRTEDDIIDCRENTRQCPLEGW